MNEGCGRDILMRGQTIGDLLDKTGMSKRLDELREEGQRMLIDQQPHEGWRWQWFNLPSAMEEALQAEKRRLLDSLWEKNNATDPATMTILGGGLAAVTTQDGCPITYWDALDGQSEEEVDEFAEEIRSDERERIASLLSTFRDDNVSQRRDTELRRVARNSLLDELSAWIAGGALEYTPKD